MMSRLMLNLRQGKVMFDGEDITALSPQERVLKGMGFVPQTHNVFTSMSVEENLEMGAYIRKDDYRQTMEQVFVIYIKTTPEQLWEAILSGNDRRLARQRYQDEVNRAQTQIEAFCRENIVKHKMVVETSRSYRLS